MAYLKPVAALTALALLGACSDGQFDFDLRNLTGGFDTSASARNLPNRPAPDSRGVISYPGYQVAVARRGDTLRDVAMRVGLQAEGLASYNAIDPDVPLRAGEIIALPVRVVEPSAATGAVPTGTIAPTSDVSVTTLAGAAIDRAEATAPAPPPAGTPIPAPTAAPATAGEPIRHRIARGETVYSISRFYGVPVRAIAEWNGLGPDLQIQEGRYLLIPQAGSAAPTPASADATAPGAGSIAPLPPSAATPLPDDASAAPDAGPETPAAPDIGQPASTPATDAPLVAPADGPIIRAYAPGRNEGIDIGAPAGTPVRAAADGTVAAVTQDTNGVSIVVIRHVDNLLTVYTNIEGITVSKGDRVSKGQTIGKVRAGDPSFVHFEVRDGLESVDPTDFLP